MLSNSWSLFVSVIVIVSLVGWALLLLWCSKDKLGVEDNADMGHEYDGIRELNTPLPKWWSYLFSATLLFAVGYLIAYPGLGNFKGVLGWTSSNQLVETLAESKEKIAEAQKNKQFNQYALELDQADKEFTPILKKAIYQADSTTFLAIPEIAKNADALAMGQNLFLQNCSQCHGASARGQFGFPNLTDNDWLYGSTPEQLKASIMTGRGGMGLMVAWKNSLPEESIKDVAAYVLTLSGRAGIDAAEATRGKEIYTANCAACHNSDGKGNILFGAPNLTDNIWLYAGDRATVEESIRDGRNGKMPAWEPILGEEKVQLLSAYIWSLSH